MMALFISYMPIKSIAYFLTYTTQVVSKFKHVIHELELQLDRSDELNDVRAGAFLMVKGVNYYH